MTTSEIAFLDANILVYAANKNSPFHAIAVALREKGLKGELSLCLAPQVLNEFFASVTNPKRLEHPFSQEEAMREMEKYFQSKRILKIHPQPETMTIVFDFLKRYKVVRQEIFDLYIVATMLSNNVTRIYTYNEKDFSKYAEIEVLNPASVIK
ncbi:MAG: PIN domain-containing protein [Melioribacteraceae bacterium]